jgi:hypothetical protein
MYDPKDVLKLGGDLQSMIRGNDNRDTRKYYGIMPIIIAIKCPLIPKREKRQGQPKSTGAAGADGSVSAIIT